MATIKMSIKIKGMSRYIWRLRIAEMLVLLARWIAEGKLVAEERE